MHRSRPRLGHAPELHHAAVTTTSPRPRRLCLCPASTRTPSPPRRRLQHLYPAPPSRQPGPLPRHAVSTMSPCIAMASSGTLHRSGCRGHLAVVIANTSPPPSLNVQQWQHHLAKLFSAAGEPPVPKSPSFSPSVTFSTEIGLRAVFYCGCREAVALPCFCRGCAAFSAGLCAEVSHPCREAATGTHSSSSTSPC